MARAADERLMTAMLSGPVSPLFQWYIGKQMVADT